MKNQTILSIVIPTHNKTDLLKLAYNSIVNEKNFEIKCELCISDNSNNENTNKFFKSIKVPKNFSYERSLEAPSLDENINKAVMMSKGTYSWIFGDDDLMVKNALSKILHILENNNPDILIINSETFYEKKIIERSRHFLSNDRTYHENDNNSFLQDMGGYLTYAPSIIIKKSLWKKNFENKFIGTFFAHLKVVFNAKINHQAIFLSDPCIRMRLHSQTWINQYFKIWYFLFPDSIWSLQYYSDEAKNKVIKQNRLNSFFSTLSSRAYGRYDFNTFKSLIYKSRKCNIFFKFYHLFVSFVPKFILKTLYILIITLGIKKRGANFSPELALQQLKTFKSYQTKFRI